MGKRKAPRLTMPNPKKSKSKAAAQALPPSDAEWKQMIRVKSFTHTDQASGKIIVISELDDITLWSNDDDSNLWLGSIAGIRVRRNEIDDRGRRAWVRIKWYYSGCDIAKEAVSLLPSVSRFAPRERALSDFSDVLEFNCISGCTYVHSWVDSQLDPPDIGPNDFFLRCHYRRDLKQLTPDPLSTACTICKVPYNPFPLTASALSATQSAEVAAKDRDSDSGYMSREESPPTKPHPPPAPSPSKIMHFCPRPGCRRWYHRACLLASHIESPGIVYIGTRGIRMLAVDPDAQEPHPSFHLYTYPRPSRGKMSSTSVEDPVQPWGPLMQELREGRMEKAGVEGVERGLGEGILLMAQQPILREPDGGVFSVAGNVKDVVLARRFVFQFLEEWHDILDEIEVKQDMLLHSSQSESRSQSTTALFADEDMDIDSEARAEQDILKWEIEDMLSSTRLLASPYEPYWTKVAERLAIRDWLSTAPAVQCPGCGGTI